jgi:tRNA(fMet)-specific endonuclease VapC
MTVVDTDVLIDALQGREPALVTVSHGLRTGGLATTTITQFELLSGAPTQKSRQAVETLLAALPVFDFDETAASAAAVVRLELEASGQPIGMADYLIAGICLARSASLLTRNRAHFRRVPGLRLVGGGKDEES